MPQTTIEELFQAPWGIVQGRRAEIEAGAFGALDRVHREEVARQFLPIAGAMDLLGRGESATRKRLRVARYIVQGGGRTGTTGPTCSP
jgi:hypothetical protein